MEINCKFQIIMIISLWRNLPRCMADLSSLQVFVGLGFFSADPETVGLMQELLGKILLSVLYRGSDEMNIIAPSALKIYVTKNHFLHWDRFKYQLSYQSKVKCPSDWPYSISQNENGTATASYFLICSCGRWPVSPGHRAVQALCLWDYLITWHQGYFRSGICWLFHSWWIFSTL